MEGKGFFTKEIEEQLLNKTIDIAVHSHKDLETTQPEGLCIAAVSDREDPSEYVLIKKDAVDPNRPNQLKLGAVVGTSSARRKSQLLATNPDVKIKDLRGNVPTRINKLRTQDYDAIMLAKAGVKRLGINLDEFYVSCLSPKEFVPAPAQGVLGIQIRQEDDDLKKILAPLNNESVAARIAIERKVLKMMDGGCQLPLGVYCEQEASGFRLWTAYAEAWNAPLVKGEYFGEQAEELVSNAVNQLRKKKVY